MGPRDAFPDAKNYIDEQGKRNRTYNQLFLFRLCQDLQRKAISQDCQKQQVAESDHAPFRVQAERNGSKAEEQKQDGRSNERQLSTDRWGDRKMQSAVTRAHQIHDDGYRRKNQKRSQYKWTVTPNQVDPVGAHQGDASNQENVLQFSQHKHYDIRVFYETPRAPDNSLAPVSNPFCARGNNRLSCQSSLGPGATPKEPRSRSCALHAEHQ